MEPDDERAALYGLLPGLTWIQALQLPTRIQAPQSIAIAKQEKRK